MIESLFTNLPTYQARAPKNRKKKYLTSKCRNEAKQVEVVKPTESKTNHNTLSDGVRNQNSFKLLDTDEDEEEVTTDHHIDSSDVVVSSV